MEKREYRVIWQREEGKRQYRYYQTLKGAKYWVHILLHPYTTELEPWVGHKVAKLIHKPFIEQREVGEWTSYDEEM